jgi:hypothetical protein
MSVTAAPGAKKKEQADEASDSSAGELQQWQTVTQQIALVLSEKVRFLVLGYALSCLCLSACRFICSLHWILVEVYVRGC